MLRALLGTPQAAVALGTDGSMVPMGTRWEQLPWRDEHPKTHSNPGVMSWGALRWEPGRWGCSAPNQLLSPKTAAHQGCAPSPQPQNPPSLQCQHIHHGRWQPPGLLRELHLISAKALFNLTHLLDFLMASAAGGSSEDRRASPTRTGSSCWCPRCRGSPPALGGHGDDVTT